MKRLLIVLCLFLLPAISTAGDRYDGFLEFGHQEALRHHDHGLLGPPGSYFNPYVIQDKASGRTYEIKPKYPNYPNRNDSMLQPGTRYNPWTVEER